MSFVPVTGPATFRAGRPPRESTVEFSDHRRTVVLPIRSALPVLTRAHARDDAHPSVTLLSGAALLGMRLVAAGNFEPSGTEVRSWRLGPLTAGDQDRVDRLVASRSDEGAAVLVREVLVALGEALPRISPGPAAVGL